MISRFGFGLVTALLCSTASAWVPQSATPRMPNTALLLTSEELSSSSDAPPSPAATSTSSSSSRRRRMLETIMISTMGGYWTFRHPSPANALVKGVSPPPKKSAGSGDKLKCTNVEECQTMAEQRDQERREEQEQGAIPSKRTAGGVRYMDIEDDSLIITTTTTGTTSGEVKEGDDVSVYFKVLKLGKRSYDGLSGEGTVVFSRGYGFEDDEDKPGSKSFRTAVGSFSNIAALNEALVGMKVGGIRRFAIVPQKGWERATKACDGGPGGKGSGGDLRTDYVVVPTATVVEQEACLDQSKQPFPSTYAQQRRMAQRFDQSLIMEVQVAKIN